MLLHWDSNSRTYVRLLRGKPTEPPGRPVVGKIICILSWVFGGGLSKVGAFWSRAISSTSARTALMPAVLVQAGRIRPSRYRYVQVHTELRCHPARPLLVPEEGLLFGGRKRPQPSVKLHVRAHAHACSTTHNGAIVIKSLGDGAMCSAVLAVR